MNPRSVLGSLLVLVAALPAARPAMADDQMEFVGRYDPSFFTHWLDVHLAGNRAYVPGVSGLSVFDIAAPNPPVFLGRYQPPGSLQFYHATPTSPLSYVTARDGGIHVLNTANMPPTLVSVHDEGLRSFEGVHLEGNLLYVTAHAEGLRIYDVTIPQSFVQLASLGGFTNAWALDKQGTHLVVADANAGIKMVDVANSSQPVIVGSAPTSGAAQDVVWKGSRAYVASGAGGVDIFDVSNPAAPVQLGNYETEASAFLLAADPLADRVYVATWDIVDVIDVSNPAQPVQAGFEDTPVRAMGVAADASHVYVADWDTFRMYRFGPTTQPDVHVTPPIVSFPVIPIGNSADTTVAVANTGGGLLAVSNVLTGHADFQATPTSFNVPAGGQVQITLTATASAAKAVGNLRVQSNDPDESGLGHLIDYGTVGLTAPDFTLNDLDGVPHTLSDLRGEIVLLAFFASW